MRENLIPGYTNIEHKRRIMTGRDTNLDFTLFIKLQSKKVVSKIKTADSSRLNMVFVLYLASEIIPSMFITIPIQAIGIERYPCSINSSNDNVSELVMKSKF